MGVTKVNKEQLIARTNYLYRTQGYHKTTMADIAATCGINKASLYHYFAGKEDFSLAVLQDEYENLKKRWFIPLLDTTQPYQQRLTNFAEDMQNYCLASEGGLLMVNLAAEASNLIPEFNKCICDFFDEWREVLAEVLKNKYQTELAYNLAENFIARLQGGVMLHHLFKDEKFITRQKDYLLNMLKNNGSALALK